MSLQSKLLLFSSLLGAIIAIGSIIESNENYNELPGHIAATVNGVVIDKQKLNTAISLIASDRREAITEKDERLALDRIIEEELLVQHAFENGFINVDDNIRKTIVRSVVDSIVEQSNTLIPDDNSLEDFYKNHQAIFSIDEQVRIIIFNSENLDDVNRAKIIWDDQDDEASVFNNIESISKWDLPNGYIPIMTLPRLIGPNLATIVKELQVSEVSAPIKTAPGYSIVALIDKKEKQVFEFEDIKEIVIQEYRRRSRDEILSNLLKDLTLRADIEINNKLD